MGYNLSTQAQISLNDKWLLRVEVRNKYPREPYPERGHDVQKLIQEIDDTTTQNMGVDTDILEVDWLN